MKPNLPVEYYCADRAAPVRKPESLRPSDTRSKGSDRRSQDRHRLVATDNASRMPDDAASHTRTSRHLNQSPASAGASGRALRETDRVGGRSDRWDAG